MTTDLHRLLHEAGFAGDWIISRATEGSSGRTWIARQPGRDLFIKLADRGIAQERLATIGVTPPLLAQGLDQGAPFSIHAFVDARVPGPAWFGANLGPVMDLVRTYQQDSRLKERLGHAAAGTLGDHLTATIAQAAAEAQRASHAAFRSHHASAAVHRLATVVRPEDAIGLVPAHTDPNNSNFLVSADRLYLIDWEGVALSDPLRDPGLILWWYVPEDGWPEAFARLGYSEAEREQARPRVYWWAAVTSLTVALWIDRQAPNDDAIRSFLDDFLHAARGLPNPKRVSRPVTL